MRTVTCIVCGKEFKTALGRHAICSNECRKARRRAMEAGYPAPGLPAPTTTCLVCGKEFVFTRGVKKTCSQECRQTRQREKWRKNYHALPPEKKQKMCERSKQHRRDDPAWAAEMDRRKWQRTVADPQKYEEKRRQGLANYQRNREAIQAKRRQRLQTRLATMSDQELLAYQERKRQYTREHRRRERADPARREHRQQYEADCRRQRQQEQAEQDLALAAAELQRRLESGQANVKVCEICGKPVVGKHARALTCSKACAYQRHHQMFQKLTEKTCPVCGCQFTPGSAAVTCSEECRTQRKRQHKRRHKEDKDRNQ